jgi:hypothetical protein
MKSKINFCFFEKKQELITIKKWDELKTVLYKIKVYNLMFPLLELKRIKTSIL